MRLLHWPLSLLIRSASKQEASYHHHLQSQSIGFKSIQTDPIDRTPLIDWDPIDRRWNAPTARPLPSTIGF